MEKDLVASILNKRDSERKGEEESNEGEWENKTERGREKEKKRVRGKIGIRARGLAGYSLILRSCGWIESSC